MILLTILQKIESPDDCEGIKLLVALYCFGLYCILSQVFFVIYLAFCLHVAQGCLDGTPNKT